MLLIYKYSQCNFVQHIYKIIVQKIYGLCGKNNDKTTNSSQNEETDTLFNAPTETLFDESISENIVQQVSPATKKSVKQIDPTDDAFLYGDSEMDIIYGESREKESHCACELPIDDNYYDNGDEEFLQDPNDDVPIHVQVDRYNDETRFRDDEEVDEGFDGVYQDEMYEIDGDHCQERGTTTFASY
jgi:hypothetical protein